MGLLAPDDKDTSAMTPTAPPTASALYKNPTLSVTERVDDLLTQMTLPEKVGQMLQLDARGDLADLVQGKLTGSLLHASPRRMIEARELVATTRLQIPLLMADDCIHGHSFWSGATIFPTQLGMACTWDPELVERGARAAAVEIAATGLHWTFFPGAVYRPRSAVGPGQRDIRRRSAPHR